MGYIALTLTSRLATGDDRRWICNKDEFKVDL